MLCPDDCCDSPNMQFWRITKDTNHTRTLRVRVAHYLFCTFFTRCHMSARYQSHIYSILGSSITKYVLGLFFTILPWENTPSVRVVSCNYVFFFQKVINLRYLICKYKVRLFALLFFFLELCF